MMDVSSPQYHSEMPSGPFSLPWGAESIRRQLIKVTVTNSILAVAHGIDIPLSLTFYVTVEFLCFVLSFPSFLTWLVVVFLFQMQLKPKTDRNWQIPRTLVPLMENRLFITVTHTLVVLCLDYYNVLGVSLSFEEHLETVVGPEYHNCSFKPNHGSFLHFESVPKSHSKFCL